MASRIITNGDAMSTPFSSGRDPKPLGDILHIANVDMGWSVEIEQAKLISEWPRLVGESTAPHTQVIELRDGVLRVSLPKAEAIKPRKITVS